MCGVLRHESLVGCGLAVLLRNSTDEVPGDEDLVCRRAEWVGLLTAWGEKDLPLLLMGGETRPLGVTGEELEGVEGERGEDLVGVVFGEGEELRVSWGDTGWTLLEVDVSVCEDSGFLELVLASMVVTLSTLFSFRSGIGLCLLRMGTGLC